MSRRSTAVLAIALVGVNLLAYWSTVHSLRTDDFDGLNNILQLPLALPWSLFISRGTDHLGNALLDLGWGLLNVAIVIAWIVIRARRRREPLVGGDSLPA